MKKQLLGICALLLILFTGMHSAYGKNKLKLSALFSSINKTAQSYQFQWSERPHVWGNNLYRDSGALYDCTVQSLQSVGLGWHDLRLFFAKPSNLKQTGSTVIKPMMGQISPPLAAALQKRARGLRPFLVNNPRVYQIDIDFWANNNDAQLKRTFPTLTPSLYEDGGKMLWYYEFAKRRYNEGGIELVQVYAQLIDDIVAPKTQIVIE